MFAATEAAAPTSTFTGIPVHPGEDASAKEEDDWWRVFDSVLSGTDAAHWIAGQPPPRLALLDPADLTDYSHVLVLRNCHIKKSRHMIWRRHLRNDGTVLRETTAPHNQRFLPSPSTVAHSPPAARARRPRAHAHITNRGLSSGS